MSVRSPGPLARFARPGGCRAVALLALLTCADGLPAQEPPPASVVFDAKAVAGKVADFAPLGGADTPDRKALVALVLHGRHFAHAALAEKAVEFPAEELQRKSDTDPNSIAKQELRFQLFKFTARLSRVTRLTPPPEVAAVGITSLYEAKVFPADRLDPVHVVLSSLPAGTAVGDQPPTAPRVLVAGYFLKVVRFRDADVIAGTPAADRFAPLLVAPTLAVSTPKSKFDFDGERAVYQGIEDFKSLRDGNRLAEGTAYEDLVRHVRQFDAKELADAAEEMPLTELLRRNQLSVPSPIPGMPPSMRLVMAREDYRFRLLKVSGQLKRVLRLPAPKDLVAGGLTDVYELWVIPANRPDDSVCVVVTDLPAGVEPTPELTPSRHVTVAGYFLKVIRYESGKTGADNKPQGTFAPLLFGRSFLDTKPPETDGGHNWRTVFLPAILAGLGLLSVLFLGLTWWFKASDRASRKAVEARRTNPFGEPTPDAAPTPPSG